MHRLFFVSLCATVLSLLAGCASAPKAPPDNPAVWSQKPEESGKLQTGKVVAIVRWQGAPPPSQSEGSEIGRGLFGMFVAVPLAIVLAPAALVVCGARDDGCAKPKKYGVWPDENGNMFRHVVRLTGTQEEVIKDEYRTFTVGDCVALGRKPEMLVAAPPTECDPKDLQENP